MAAFEDEFCWTCQRRITDRRLEDHFETDEHLRLTRASIARLKAEDLKEQNERYWRQRQAAFQNSLINRVAFEERLRIYMSAIGGNQ